LPAFNDCSVDSIFEAIRHRSLLGYHIVKAVNIENTQKREGNLKNTAASIEEVLKIRHRATRWAAID